MTKNLISVSGRIGMGKDTVAQIIQFLTSDDEELKAWFLEEPYKALKEWNGNFDGLGPCQVKKFADKLKDIVCIIIGCTREQLENHEFKATELGEEWRVWFWSHYKLEGHTDSGRLGKLYTNEASALEEQKRWSPNFEDGLVKNEILTPRKILQLLGTDGMRNLIHPNIHINALFADYKPFPKGEAHDLKNFSALYSHTSCRSCQKSYSGWKRQWLCKSCIEDESIQFYPQWIVTDTRFPNELEAIKSRNGLTIRVKRDFESPTVEDGIKPLHESETALDNSTFDYEIDNSGTLEELVEKVKEILITEKIIES